MTAFRPNLRLLAAALLVLLLSGCFGAPDGAQPGDAVAVQYTVYDLADGRVVVDAAETLVTVGDASALGADVAKALEGAQAGDTLVVESRDDAGRTYSEEVLRPRALEPVPARDEAAQQDIEAAFGPVEAGDAFPYQFFTLRVLEVGNGTVAYELQLNGTNTSPARAVGSNLRTWVEDGMIHQELDPNPGATFEVLPPTPFNPSTPLDLEPGQYRVAGTEGEDIVFERAPVSDKALLDRDVKFEITVLAVSQPAGPEAPEGEYGHRDSPYLLGDAADAEVGGDQADSGDGHDEPVHADETAQH